MHRDRQVALEPRGETSLGPPTRHPPIRSFVVVLFGLIFGLAVLLSSAAAADAKPLILIFAPDCPEYGHQIERIIQGINGIEAETDVVESPEAFRLLAFLPRIKMMIIVLSRDKDYGIGPILQWFFRKGGGLIGIGFAGSEKSVGKAAEEVFPIFGNSYRTGLYDKSSKSFVMTHVKETEDEISKGLGNFSIQDQKIILSFSVANNSYAPRYPEKGNYKVLYREELTRAPSIIKYVNEGISVTFACFAGEDIQRAVDYYGHFTGTPQFQSLLSNAALSVWNNEKKYTSSLQVSQTAYSSMSTHLAELRETASKRRRAEMTARGIRVTLTVLLAAVAIGVVYRLTFR